MRGFDWQLGGLIDKDPPAIPVTAPVREPALFTLDVSTGTARSYPQHTQAHTPTPREQPKHLASHNLGFLFKSTNPLMMNTRERGMLPSVPTNNGRLSIKFQCTVLCAIIKSISVFYNYVRSPTHKIKLLLFDI